MIKNVYQGGGNALANYDYTDIAEGTGMQAFYACSLSQGTDGASKAYVLLTDTTIKSSYALLGGFNKKFEVTFNLPKIVGGTAMIQIPFSMQSATGSVSCAIIKSSDGVETTIGPPVRSYDETAPASQTYYVHPLKTTISRTHFKKGDKLILNVEGLCAAGGADEWIFFDPSNTRTTGQTTRLTALIPFVLDV